jgi:hypothetical protein
MGGSVGRREIAVNWDAVGAIAELLGALGVIATLIYLAAQIRQSSDLVRHATASASRAARNDVSRILVTDERANRIYWEGIKSRSALSLEDRQFFDPLMALVCENLLETAEYGLHDETAGNRMHVVGTAGFQEYWKEFSSMYRYDFRELIDKEIKELVDEALAGNGPAAQQSAAADSA